LDEEPASAPLDPVGNIAYEAWFQHQRTLQICVAVLSAVVIILGALLAVSMRRPPIVIVDRVDSDGHVQVSNYAGVQYTPREAEIRARLNDWAIDRYRLVKDLGTRNFKLNYYYLSNMLAQKLMQPDAARVAKILAGSEPEQDVQIDAIRFTDVQPAKGEAVIEMIKIVGTGDTAERQRWNVTLRYEVDWIAAAKRGEADPQFLNINPLGVTVTWFHEDRADR
jgi:type IV secretion system protein VirB5